MSDIVELLKSTSDLICLGAADEITRLRAENAELRKDAERYRWLRFATDEQLAVVRSFSDPDEEGKLWLPEGDSFDAAIDAAMGKGEVMGK